MGAARLKSVTGESVEIRFLSDPYVRGTTWFSVPGSGGACSTKATDIRISFDVPVNRPLPDYVLIRLHAKTEEGQDREFELTLGRTGDRSYSGRLDQRLLIMSGSHGKLHSYEQVAEFVLIQGGHSDTLVDPISQTTQFRINLDKASFSD